MNLPTGSPRSLRSPVQKVFCGLLPGRNLTNPFLSIEPELHLYRSSDGSAPVPTVSPRSLRSPVQIVFLPDRNPRNPFLSIEPGPHLYRSGDGSAPLPTGSSRSSVQDF